MRLCRVCKTVLSDSGSRTCRVCYRKQAPATPLRAASEKLGLSLARIAKRASVHERTVERVASGRPAGRRVALALERVTGVDAGLLMRGTVAPDPQVRR